MKRVAFNTDLGAHITGIVTNYKESWQKLVPACIRHKLSDLYQACNGDLENLHGFYVGMWPIFAIIIFLDQDGADLFSTLSHESSHVARQIIWGIGDKISEDGDETYAKLQTDIYETFKTELEKKYGMVYKIEWKPNVRQKKRELK